MTSTASSPAEYTTAERAVLACVMRSRGSREAAVGSLTAADFSTFAGRALFVATMGLHAEGVPVTPWSIAERAKASLAFVADAQNADTAGATDIEWMRALRDESMRRNVRQSAVRLAEQVARSGFTEDHVRDALAEMSVMLPSAAANRPPQTADDVVASTSTDYEWLVPWMLERGERLLLVGEEGKGKSVLLRQWAFQLAAGCHWVTTLPVRAASVLIVDAENSMKNIVRSSKWLLKSAREFAERNGGWEPDRLRIETMPNVDIVGNREHRDTIANWIEHLRPDLLIIGPLYKVGRNTARTYEDSAVAMTDVIDDWRDRYGIAVAMEHHAPKGNDASGQRSINPFGSSVWLRWPEIGLALTHYDNHDDNDRSECTESRKHFHVSGFRGFRGTHMFPRHYRHGDWRHDAWPWISSLENPSNWSEDANPNVF